MPERLTASSVLAFTKPFQSTHTVTSYDLRKGKKKIFRSAKYKKMRPLKHQNLYSGVGPLGGQRNVVLGVHETVLDTTVSLISYFICHNNPPEGIVPLTHLRGWNTFLMKIG